MSNAAGAPRRQGHGVWPYFLPYVGFLLTVEIAGRLPDAAAPVMLFVKPLVPLVLIVWFWRGGAYPELRGVGIGAAGALQDVAVGLGLALLWMAPYLQVPALRPDPSEAFDPTVLGAGSVALALGVRMFGYAIVTPLFEELFIRSFVMRFAEVWWERGDFRDVPLARYGRRGFVASVVIFTAGHVFWEWWVAIPWVVLTNLWFYHRRNLWSLILVHGVTNATLLLLAIFGDGLFHDADGTPISLWFFV